VHVSISCVLRICQRMKLSIQAVDCVGGLDENLKRNSGGGGDTKSERLEYPSFLRYGIC
jgi:hypothetical protein